MMSLVIVTALDGPDCCRIEQDVQGGSRKGTFGIENPHFLVLTDEIQWLKC